MRFELGFSREEVFSFTPIEGGETISIMSGQLRSWLLANAMDKVIDLTFPEEHLADIIVNHGLEAPRIASMTEAEAKEPVIIGLWPTGTHVLIDGGHRRYYWASRGINTIRGWAVPEAVWRSFEFNPRDYAHALHLPDGALLPQRMKQ